MSALSLNNCDLLGTSNRKSILKSKIVSFFFYIKERPKLGLQVQMDPETQKMVQLYLCPSALLLALC